MAATAAPYGLKVVGFLQGRQVGVRRAFVISANNSAAIFNGDAVTINGGAVSALTSSPTTTRNNQTPIGVFVGCEYIDPVAGLREQQYLPANAVNAGYTKIRVFVEDYHDAIYQIQATGTVALSSIGKNAALNFGTAGSTVTGNSGMALDQSTIATTATLAFRIIDLVNSTSSSGAISQPGDAFTDVLVVWNQGVHAYENSTGA